MSQSWSTRSYQHTFSVNLLSSSRFPRLLVRHLSYLHSHITITIAQGNEKQSFSYKQYYPSSNQFRDPPTYTHQPSMQQKVPFSLISCSSSKVAFCSCVEWGWHIYNIVESESDPLTRRAVDLFEKEPLKGNSEVHLHTPTKFGEDRSKDLGGDREQTDRQTNRQTDKRCSIYSMITWVLVQMSTFNSYSASRDSWCTATLWNRIMTAQCEGMGEVGSVRYEPALLPPCPSIRVLSYSNCQEIHSCQQTGQAV